MTSPEGSRSEAASQIELELEWGGRGDVELMIFGVLGFPLELGF